MITLSAFRLALYALMLISSLCFGQNELPPSVANVQSIKVGSFIIPMDTTFQRLPGYFNLKAYGLVNALLQNEIPVKWAIRKSKTRAATGTGSRDFPANSNRVYPDTSTISTLDFRNGPFIIDSAWVSKALPIISAYGNNVTVYKLNTQTNIDIRYNLTFKPFLVLLNANNYDTLTVQVLNEAGIPSSSYFKQAAGQIFVPSSGYTLASDAHYVSGDTNHINPVLRFVKNYGGNLIANCAAIGAFENKASIMTTAGIDSSTFGISNTQYFNPDLPIAQFLGPLVTPNGEYKYWQLKTGSTMSSNTYEVVRDSSATPRHYVVMGSKIRPNAEKGSNVFYLPGHEYGAGILFSNTRINGRRIFLNSIFIPPNDSTARDFITDVKLNIVPQSGFAVKNETFQINVILSNIGHWRAKNLSVQVPLLAGLIYQSHTLSNGSYNSGTGAWVLDSIVIGRIDTLKIMVLINQLGAINFNGIAVNQSLENVVSNNSSGIVLTGVSRPVGVNDVMNFFSPLYQDISTKNNDSDEDGGPFGNTQIVAGPYHGSAQVVNGDTIRYTLDPAYAGMDSLLYTTCDQYPLCDTAWLMINIPFPLPITLLKFDGKRNDGEIDLHWITLNETQNDYFSIERCNDNITFETRGKVKGAGHSNYIRNYTFTDTDNNEPIYYYRLKQVDYNGQSHLSPVIALAASQSGKLLLKLIPNPMSTHQQLLVLMQGLQKGISILNVSDMTGRTIVQKNIEIKDLNQTAFLSINGVIENGCYMVTISNAYEKLSTRLIVQ